MSARFRNKTRIVRQSERAGQKEGGESDALPLQVGVDAYRGITSIVSMIATGIQPKLVSVGCPTLPM